MEVINNQNNQIGPGTGTVAQWLIEEAVKESGRKINQEKYQELMQFCKSYDKLVATQQALDYAVELVDEDTNVQFTVTVPGVFEEVPKD